MSRHSIYIAATLALVLTSVVANVPGQTTATYLDITGCEQSCEVAASGLPVPFIADNPGLSPVNRADLMGAVLGLDRVLWDRAALSFFQNRYQTMRIRALEDQDIPRWIELRTELWPHGAPAELDAQGRTAIAAVPRLVVFVAEEGGTLVGFLELGLRSVAEGCTSSPVPYVEGWYVAGEWRRRGIGGALMTAAEAWSRERGHAELGSDTEQVNHLSRAAHAALGFEEVETLVVFRKPL